MTKSFVRATLERAVKTFAQTLAAVLVASGTGLLDTDWIASLSMSAMAALLSVLTSIGSGAVTGGGPSLTNDEVLEEHA